MIEQKQNKLLSKIKIFFKITKEKILWFIILAMISVFLISVYESSLLFLLGSALFFGGGAFFAFMVLIIMLLNYLFIYPYVIFHGSSVIELIYIPSGLIIFFQFLYICFLTYLIVFIREHTSGKKVILFLKCTIKFIICIAIFIFLTNILITQVHNLQIQTSRLAVEQGSIKDCEKLSGAYKYGCYKKIALNTGASSLCEHFETDETKSFCYRDVALKFMNGTLCEKIKADNYNEDYMRGRSECFFTIAKKTNNSEICEKMSNSKDSYYKRDQCYMKIALQTSNNALCELSETTEYSDYCYLEFAKKYNKTEYCYKIPRITSRESNNSRDECLSALEINKQQKSP